MKRLILILLIAFPLAAQKTEFDPASRRVIEQRIFACHGKDQEREDILKRMFQEDHCPQVSEQSVKGQNLPNVICVFPGELSKTIIVGAHYDHVDAGDGIIDNWSGASLLPSLLHSLAATPRRHTFVFIGFAAEEKGLLGSHFYVHEMIKNHNPPPEAMVNLDTLGLGPTKVWASHANPQLLSDLARTAASMKLPLAAFNVELVAPGASADSESFRENKVPAITIHSATQGTMGLLHSPEDNRRHLRLDDYYDSYRLIAAYLAYLDTALPAATSGSSGETKAPQQ